MLKSIPVSDLVCMDEHAERCGFHVNLAYARTDNLLFGERLYRTDARLYLHKDLAAVVCRAAQICRKTHNARFILYDGLRTTDAQTRMLQTRRVRENPHWLEEPRLLSPPGAGGHPRGMAIDIGLEDLRGNLLDMGTPFDFLAENAHPDHNPAHRAHPNLSEAARANRHKLDESMREAGQSLNTTIFPLPQEWWDFRLPPEVFNTYTPISESDLPPDLRLL
jgi:zinc D-Ala-D-Ala dipeptidase